MVFIYADMARLTGSRRVVRNDYRNVADLRDDGVLPVGFALAKTTRMDMQIGDDAPASFAAMLPQASEIAAIDYDDARTKTMRVHIIVENEFFDHPPPLLAT
jgi:hypothetical protein